MQEGIEYALTPMVNWFQKELRGVNPAISLADQPGFHQWICAQEQAQKLQYVVRARGPVCAGSQGPFIGGLQLESGSLGASAEGQVSFEGAQEAKGKETSLLHLDSTVETVQAPVKETTLFHVDSTVESLKPTEEKVTSLFHFDSQVGGSFGLHNKN